MCLGSARQLREARRRRVRSADGACRDGGRVRSGRATNFSVTRLVNDVNAERYRFVAHIDHSFVDHIDPVRRP